jgi:phosphatidylglycerophosphatase C
VALRHNPSSNDASEGRNAAANAALSTSRPLVAFDFDGTLTCRESFVDFLSWRRGHLPFALGIAHLAPAFARYPLDRDRGRLKAAMAHEFLRGEARATLVVEAERYAADMARSLLRPDALMCWRLWRERNARLVIVTASPEFLVAPFARGLVAEALIGTRLEFAGDDTATGALDGPNCRAEEKVVRLKAAFGDDVRLDAAYGDGDGDLAMLSIAEEAGMKVFRQRP